MNEFQAVYSIVHFQVCICKVKRKFAHNFSTFSNICGIPRENANKRRKLLITEFKVKSCFAYISQMLRPYWVILVPKWRFADGESKNIVLDSISVFRLFIFVFPKITVKRSVNTGWKLILKISWRIMADDEYNQFCLKSLPQRQ